MSRRQLATLVLLNALLALLISLGVLWAGLRLGWLAPATQATPYVIVVPTPTPLPTPQPARPVTPSPTVASEVYVVQPGDTLLGIAGRLNVNPALLLALNEIGDADRLLAGQRLLVPLGSLPTMTPSPRPASPTATATVTASPTAPLPPTATATELAAAATVTTTVASAVAQPVIREIVSPGQWATEAIAISNAGQEPLLLLNWSLSQEGGSRYIFPAVVLAPGAAVWVHTGPGVDDPEHLHWSRPEAVWTAAGSVILANPAGEPVASYAIDAEDG